MLKATWVCLFLVIFTTVYLLLLCRLYTVISCFHVHDVALFVYVYNSYILMFVPVKHNTVTKHLLPSAPRLSKPLPPVPFFNNVPSAPTSYHVPPSVTTVATHALPPSLPTKALPPLPPSQTLYPSLSKALAPLIPSKPALSKPFSIPQYYPNVKSNDPAELGILSPLHLFSQSPSSSCTPPSSPLLMYRSGLMVFVYSCDQAQQGTVKDNRYFSSFLSSPSIIYPQYQSVETLYIYSPLSSFISSYCFFSLFFFHCRGNLLYTFQKEGDCIALLDTLDQVRHSH